MTDGQLPAQDRDPQGAASAPAAARSSSRDARRASSTWSLRHRARRARWPGPASSSPGVLAFRRLPLDAFPDTTPVQVQVNTVAPALSPLEIERQITAPVEQAISGLPGLDEVRSLSKFGLSQVTVDLRGRHRHLPRAAGGQRAARSASSCPTGIERPTLGPVATGLGEVFHYLVTRRRATSLAELRTVHDWIIEPQLRSVPGRRRGQRLGRRRAADPGRRRPGRAPAARPDARRPRRGARGEQRERRRRHARRRRASRASSRASALVDRRRGRRARSSSPRTTACRSASRDVARGRRRPRDPPRRGHRRRQGRGGARPRLHAHGREQPRGHAAGSRRGSTRSQKTPAAGRRGRRRSTSAPTSSIRCSTPCGTNLFEGALLVIAVLFVFLGNLRAGLIVAAAIPLSMLFAVDLMLRVGIAGSLMSLGAIDFGLVVDSSVIMVENAVRRLAEDGGERADARRSSATPRSRCASRRCSAS